MTAIESRLIHLLVLLSIVTASGSELPRTLVTFGVANESSQPLLLGQRVIVLREREVQDGMPPLTCQLAPPDANAPVSMEGGWVCNPV